MLRVYDLPTDHDIGVDPEELKNNFGGQNPFGGVTICDSQSRLLGYIIYPLANKADAAHLKKYLEQYNRFHNVLVVYPDKEKANLELWQGTEQLKGKLRKGQDYKEDAAHIVNLLSRFFVVSKAKVKNPRNLAEELAFRARYLHRLALKQLKEEDDKGDLRKLYNAFKEALIHDQTEDQFADAFAQTITYGLLTARWIARNMLISSSQRFTRHTALEHLKSANPFLENMFDNVLGAKHGQRNRLIWLVEDIAALLERVDVIKVFGEGDAESDKATDPIIHFYEPFLAAYNKDLKNKRGVFFTPRPVVSYIVRSVHELLQTEFGLEDGLASTATWGDAQKNFPDLKLPEGVKPEDPFVCILDPATGTGTFLFECIEVIERTVKDRWCSKHDKKNWKDPAITKLWNEYVSKHLLSRLYGYEIMMASYAVAHLKLSFKLAQTGYKLKEEDRINVYLTNSLEPPSKSIDPKLANLFISLAQEAQEVNEIKRYKNFTIIIGNPPYSKHSSHQGEWLKNLLRGKDTLSEREVVNYYSVDGAPLGERNPKWLNDDYVKFIRLSQWLIEKIGCGILAFITNHGYLDNGTFRGMRQSLMQVFDGICLLDLHGNSKKHEKAPDGGLDENVFDIQQGVSVGLFARSTKEKVKTNSVHHTDLFGIRESKYEWLQNNDFLSTKWVSLTPNTPKYLFKPQNNELSPEYEQWWLVQNIFPYNAVGFQTHRDYFVLDTSRKDLLNRMKDFADSSKSDEEMRQKYFAHVPSSKYPKGDTRDWKLAESRRVLEKIVDLDNWITKCIRRPFDFQWYFHHPSAIDYGRPQVMDNLIYHKNLALLWTRPMSPNYEFSVLATNVATDQSVVGNKSAGAGGTYVATLYQYPSSTSTGKKGLFDEEQELLRRSNLAAAFIDEVSTNLKLNFVSDGCGDLNENFGPEDIFHYIYAVFHSPTYCNRYEQFLKRDFPRLPLTSNLNLFRCLVQLGEELLALHLVESESLTKFITKFIQGKSLEVDKITYSNSTVWIDKKNTTGFKGVPEDVWSFHIGGYQVCEKWLKDRKGRTLSQEDIEHYQKIIVALNETIRIMQEIDEVIDEHGGWPDAFAKGVGGSEK